MPTANAHAPARPPIRDLDRGDGLAGIAVIVSIGCIAELYNWMSTRFADKSTQLLLTLDAASERLFYWHPMLMMLSAVLFTTVGVLAFRTAEAVSQKERKHIKYVHAAVLTFASVFAFLGLYPVLKTRGFQLSVFHHWIGYLALLLMLQNYALGILKFVFKFQIFESCLGHVKKGAGVVQTYIPTHRNLGLATIVAIYVAAISGVYKLANCGSVSGCGGGTSLLLLLVIGLCMVMGALHPQFLYPDNLCEPCLDKVAAWCKACCEPHQERRHNSDDGDAADNLLPASRGGYGSSDRNSGACAGGSGDDLSTSGSSYDSDGRGHRLSSEGGYHQTSVTQRNPANTSYNGAQLPIGGMMTFPDAGSGAAATGAGAGAGAGNVGGKKKSSRKHAAKKADNTKLARENVDDERYGAV